MFPTLILSSFVGTTLPEEVVDRMVSTRTVVVERQVKLDVAVYIGDPLGSPEAGTIKTLAAPTLILTHKRAGFVRIEQAAGQGITFRATPQLRLDGKIAMECEPTISTANSSRGVQTVSGFIPGVDEQRMKASVVLTPGKSLKVRLAAKSPTEQTWMELTASVVEPQLANPKVEEPKRMTWSVTSTMRIDPCILPASYSPIPFSPIAPSVPMLMPAVVGK